VNAAPRTVLVVHEGKRGPTATQNISFGQPFAGIYQAAPVRIVFEQDRADPAIIRDLFAQHKADLLVLSRYTKERGSDWIALARQAGIPVIFHIDDDLLAVPSSLGTVKHSAYSSPERLAALRQNIDSSDLLYVSTAELARRFEEHGVQAPIVAGDIYCSVSPSDVGALVGPATGPVIGYMGTSGHAADLAMIIPALCRIMEAVPDLQFEVFGTIAMPPELARFGRRVRHLAPVADYADFLPRLRSLGWWIGVAPLDDNIFNRCKADTKWVEYSLAGMAVVASDLPVYHRACAGGAGMLVASIAGWSESLLTLLHRPDIRSRMIDAAQRKLRERYSHERLRQQLLDVFDRAALKPLPESSSADGRPQPAH
jgi:glycosyltransferase involved in cell wall biosynthesis